MFSARLVGVSLRGSQVLAARRACGNTLRAARFPGGLDHLASVAPQIFVRGRPCVCPSRPLPNDAWKSLLRPFATTAGSSSTAGCASVLPPGAEPAHTPHTALHTPRPSAGVDSFLVAPYWRGPIRCLSVGQRSFDPDAGEQLGGATGASSLARQVGSKGLVFEFSMFWIISAWKEIGIGFIRNTFYTFRPVIMFFVMGYVVKFAFFLMGAPMLVSFYSVWLFEVGYGLAQCVLSVIFLTQLAYMDMSFRGRIRPALRLARRQAGNQLRGAGNQLSEAAKQLWARLS